MKRENLVLEELEKRKYIQCSEQMLNKMQELVNFEKTWWWKSKKTPKRVPEKKGIIFTNKKEIEKIKQENAVLLREQTEGKEKYAQMLADLMKEKQENHVTEQLFFESPLLTCSNDAEIHHLKTCGEALYGYGKTENRISDFAYSVGAGRTGKVDMITYLSGEAWLYIYDKEHNFICYKNPKGNGERLYFDGMNYESAKCKYEDMLTALCDQEYLCLYSDLELLKNSQEKQFELQYIWDFRNQAIYSSEKIKELYDEQGWKDADENIEAYFSNAKKMTDFYVKTCEGVMSYRDRVVNWPNEKYCGDNERGCCYEIFARKKALVFSCDNHIAAILIPKEETEVLNIRGNSMPFTSTTKDEYQQHYCIKEIFNNPGTNWEFYAASTMHYVAYQLKDKMKPMNLRERKPEGMPDSMWRLWIRMRFDK